MRFSTATLGVQRPIPSLHTTYRPIWYLAAFFGLAGLAGLRGAYSPVPSLVDVLIPWGLALCTAWWALADARATGRPVPMLTGAWFIVFAPFLVPGYLLWSRGWRGLGYLLLLAFAWIAVFGAAMVIAGSLLFGESWWQAIQQRGR